MNDTILEYKLTGSILLDLEKVKKKWHTNCSIIYSNFNNNEQYTLVEYTPKKIKRKLKINISKEQALKIISMIPLYYCKSPIFNNAGSYTDDGLQR